MRAQLGYRFMKGFVEDPVSTVSCLVGGGGVCEQWDLNSTRGAWVEKV